MILDVSDAIETFASDVVVRRPGPFVVTDGRASSDPGLQTEFTVRGMFRPIPGHELQQEPWGERADAGIRGWVRAELQTSAVGRGADIVEWDGEDWLVVAVQAAQPQGNYWRVDAVRRGQ